MTATAGHWSRRDFVSRTSLAGGTGLLGLLARPGAAAPPPVSYALRLDNPTILGDPRTLPYAWVDSHLEPIRNLPPATDYTWWASGGSGNPEPTRGSLDNPVVQKLGTQPYGPPLGPNVVQGVPRAGQNGIKYAGGGQIIQYSPSLWLYLLYCERWRYGSDYAKFRSVGALAKSTDRGATWIWLGEIINLHIGYTQIWATAANSGFGGHAITTVDGKQYVYIYYSDWLADNPIVATCVARCPLADLVNWAQGGPPATFLKYYNRSFSESGISGRSSPIEPGDTGATYQDVKWNEHLQRYLMVYYAPSLSPGWPDTDIYILDSSNLLNWGNKRALIVNPSASDFYPTLIGLGADPRVLGQSFYLYWMSSVNMRTGVGRRTDDQVLKRVRVTIS